MTTAGFELFRRQSLVDQAAQALRLALEAGELPDPLPGELELSRRLGISRPSLRAALARLEAEGRLSIAPGRRTRVQSRLTARPKSARVCLLCPQSRPDDRLGQHPLLLELRSHLAAQGVAWDEVFDATLARRHPESRLEQLAAERPGACWLLLSAPASVQRWAARAQLRGVVLGSSPAGLPLPSVDLDHSAVGRHAAGALLSLGHRQFGLVLPGPALAGDLACRDGFRHHLAAHASETTCVEVTGQETPARLRRAIDRLLRQDQRPTAWFTMRPAETVTTLTHLLSSGCRIPQEVSLLSRDSHPLLDAALPELSRYTTPLRAVVRRAVRLVQSLVAGDAVSPLPHLVIPRFLAGQTIQPPPGR